MRFYRDDCSSLKDRATGQSTVFARIVSLNPDVLEDNSGRLEVNLPSSRKGVLKVNDYAYFVFDCSQLPTAVCTRVTPALEEIYPVAQYQLQLTRVREQSEAEKNGSGVPARSIEASVEQSGAFRDGTFRVDSVLYRSNLMQVSSFNLLHHSNFPNSSFTIASTTSEGRTQPPRATADQGFDLILDKLSAGLVPVPNTAFVVQGNEYHLKDFRIRVGTVSMGATTKGVVVEVEYAPVSSVYQCGPLLTEFVETFFPGQSQRKPDFLSVKHGSSAAAENYSAIDTLAQYLDIFNGMQRKA